MQNARTTICRAMGSTSSVALDHTARDIAAPTSGFNHRDTQTQRQFSVSVSVVFCFAITGAIPMLLRRAALASFLMGVSISYAVAQTKPWTPPKTPWGDP